MDKDLDKLVDAAIEDAIIEKHEKYNYEDETENAEDSCCLECSLQEVYFLKR
jgi:hypothetical protein